MSRVLFFLWSFGYWPLIIWTGYRLEDLSHSRILSFSTEWMITRVHIPLWVVGLLVFFILLLKEPARPNDRESVAAQQNDEDADDAEEDEDEQSVPNTLIIIENPFHQDANTPADYVEREAHIEQRLTEGQRVLLVVMPDGERSIYGTVEETLTSIDPFDDGTTHRVWAKLEKTHDYHRLCDQGEWTRRTDPVNDKARPKQIA